jgi:hypothetical protein
MPSTRRNELTRLLARISAKIREAESLTVAKGDDDTLQRASKVLAELRAQRRAVEAKLQGKK